jgi:hypothetical protein
MRPSSAITTIRTTHGSQFVTHEMTASRSAMSTPAKYLDLVYKV